MTMAAPVALQRLSARSCRSNDGAIAGGIPLPCRAIGAEPTAEMKESGTKFGRWLDLTFMQLVLPAPPSPFA